MTSKTQVVASPRREVSHITSKPTTTPLLQQMEMMLQGWETIGEEAGENVLQAKLNMLETTRAVLGLFSAGSGIYQPILSRQLLFLFELIEDLARLAVPPSERKEEDGSQNMELQKAGPAHERSLQVSSEQAAQRCEYAFNRLHAVEGEMKMLAERAGTQWTGQKLQIQELKDENKKLLELIEYQATRHRLERIKDATGEEIREEPDTHAHMTAKILKLQMEAEQFRKEAMERDEEYDKLEKYTKQLKKLNGKYAMQAVELAARVKVFNEHNEKFATLLSLQYDERQATERENALLRAELMDLSKYHRLQNNLEGEVGTMVQEAELRPVRHALGANNTIPRHLAHCGLINRIHMPKEAALSLVSDMLSQRESQGMRLDFQAFIHAYLTKKHQADAIIWAYSLDEACKLYDADCNLHTFGLVSRRSLSESIYSVIHTDITILMEACEIMDELQHGEVRLTVPVVHVLGILLEMYPQYSESAYRRLYDELQSTLTTNNAHAHYRMLFPNLDRDELTNPGETFTNSELRKENTFSAMFKELIVDDVLYTLQKLEDALLHSPSEKVFVSELDGLVQQMLGTQENPEAASQIVASLTSEIITGLKETLSSSQLENAIPTSIVIAVLRTRTTLRRSIYRFESIKAENVKKQIASQAASDWANVTGEELLPIDYHHVLASTKTKRIVDEEEDDEEV